MSRSEIFKIISRNEHFPELKQYLSVGLWKAFDKRVGDFSVINEASRFSRKRLAPKVRFISPLRLDS